MNKMLKQKTITWPEELLKFVDGPLFEKTRIKFTQVTQLAMEDWLKKNGHWDAYQASLVESIL